MRFSSCKDTVALGIVEPAIFANLLCALWSDEKSGIRFLVLSNTQYAAD